MPAHCDRQTPRALLAFALLAALLLAIPSVAFASSTGSGGWYWPVGTENFQGWDGWWVYRSGNHSWHMAQDMPSPAGHPVYAVGDGVVLESEAGSGYGGVLVILHRTLEGDEFKAVYGHIIRRNLDKGDRVLAGQVIGTVNSCRHVHFGIHPGRAYPSDRNPFRGHTYTRTVTYGWVDPVRFLRDNPRAMSYIPPPLPRVTVVTSTVIPTFLGVAEECVYFSIPASGGVTATFRRPLAGGTPSEIPTEEPLPHLDATRFAAASCAASSIAVYDRLPKFAASYSSMAPAWHAAVTVTGLLTNRGGKSFGGAKVSLQRSYDGTSWATVASTTTGPHGKYWLQFVPDRRCSLRLRFTPPTRYLPATTASATLAPRPGLGRPSAPTSVRANQGFLIGGKLRARHGAGTHTVTLQFQQLRGSRWIDAFSRRTTNRDDGAATLYERKTSLPTGTWRVRARSAADAAHAAENSRWLTLKSN